MYYANKKSTTAVVLALELLKERLQRRYDEAADRQHRGKKPSGRMTGLAEAIREVDNLIQEHPSLQEFGPILRMSIPESQTDIGHGVELQVWFNRVGENNVRSEAYLFEDGSVVAYQDCVNGVNTPLHMSSMFKVLYEGEPAFDTILTYAGVSDINKVKLYTLEG